MAKRHCIHSRVYIDDFNLSTVANKTNRAISVDTADVTNMSSGGSKEYLEGPYDLTSGVTAFADLADENWDEVAFSKVTTAGDDHYVLQLVGLGATIPAPLDIAWEDIVRWTAQPRSFDIGGAIMLDGSWQGTGGTARGIVLNTAALTATGAGTGQNHGATTSPTTVVVTYRVLAAAGTGSIAIALEQFTSDTPASYAAVAALASGTITITGGVADLPVVRKTDTASSQAWKRINVTTFATITSCTVLVTITVKK